MSDFQDRRPAHRDPAGPRGQGGQQGHGEQGQSGQPGQWRGDGAGPVHQVVFRWEGNQGRQGTGMKAVAHSCPAERAEELGRELGPLLWVSGAASPRQSVVRTMSLDGDVMLVQRWPTLDRGGRPSTVSHVLIGHPRTLGPAQCLALAHGGWGSSRESAESASGRLPAVEYARLEKLVAQRLPRMTELLPTVRRALVLVAAEWLRDPGQRVSLLTDGTELTGWPDRDSVPLVYLGLYLLFGSWLGREWTFATYDTSDTHDLRLMCVARWEPDAGGSGPLARVMGRVTGRQQFEHMAATRLVDRLLARPPAGPGMPQLVDGLRDGAALDWPRRRVLLKEVLSADHRPGARTTPSPDLPPAPDHAPEPHHPPEPHRAPEPHHPPEPHRAPEPHHPPEPMPEPLSPPPVESGGGCPPDVRRTVLHDGLRAHRRTDPLGRGVLAEQLREMPDDLLLDELRSARLPQESVELLLNELGDAHRVRARTETMRHELCAEVLRNGLYFTSNGLGAEPLSRTAMATRAAELFTWAVAPLARDERYLRDLQELLHRMSRDRHPTAGNWLRQSITEPPNGRAPDLPPVVWQQLLRDMISRNTVPPPPPPPAAQAALSTPAYAPVPGPESSSATQSPSSLWERLSARTNEAGCVVGSSLGVVVVLIVIMLFYA